MQYHAEFGRLCAALEGADALVVVTDRTSPSWRQTP